MVPSERGFFDAAPSSQPKQPTGNSRPEGVPLSEQHKLTTTIATSVANDYNHYGNSVADSSDKQEDFPGKVFIGQSVFTFAGFDARRFNLV